MHCPFLTEPPVHVMLTVAAFWQRRLFGPVLCAVWPAGHTQA